MAQYTIEALTIVTAVVILTILAVYLLILKKNGWLGGGSKLYLCSNRECRKVFQKPVELKDLSEIPARVYLACPHCGTNLESVLGSRIERKPKLEAEIPLQQNKTGIKIETRETETTEQGVSPHKKPSKPASEKTTMPEQVHAPQAKNTELAPTHETVEIETAFPSSSGCQYGYGYLSQRKKGEGIPDTCVGCPKSIDCMLSEYYKKRERASVKEIKKWYSY